VLFPRPQWPGLADGTITVAFRRWKRPTVRTGGTLLSPAGLLAIDEVAAIGPADVGDADARAAGYSSVEEALGWLPAEGQLYRVRLHRVGDDPRLALRQRTEFADDELSQLVAAVRRLPWAVPALHLIGEQPGVVSTELAPALGLERLPFKQRVRRLKALGLTESLAVGYRLSPRGEALLAAIDGDRA